MRSRRRLLAALAAGSVKLSGCLTASEDDAERVAIDGIEVENNDSSTHEVAVRVLDGDDAVVFEESVSLEGGQARALDPGLDGAGDFSVSADIGGDAVESPAAAYADADDGCVRPVVRVTSKGALGLSGQSFDDC